MYIYEYTYMTRERRICIPGTAWGWCWQEEGGGGMPDRMKIDTVENWNSRHISTNFQIKFHILVYNDYFQNIILRICSQPYQQGDVNFKLKYILTNQTLSYFSQKIVNSLEFKVPRVGVNFGFERNLRWFQNYVLC